MISTTVNTRTILHATAPWLRRMPNLQLCKKEEALLDSLEAPKSSLHPLDSLSAPSQPELEGITEQPAC